jgi:hypothetical protein
MQTMLPVIRGRRQITPEGQRQMIFKATGDCDNCPFWKPLNSKCKGIRIPGGFGKCTRSRGHCNPEKVALGIGGVEAIWQPKVKDRPDPESTLRAMWDAKGVPKEQQDTIIADVTAKVQAGAKIGPFTIGDEP